MTADEAKELLSICAKELTEYFDAVQILATWEEEGETMCFKDGIGNSYARKEMAREFIEENIADIHARQLAKEIEPPDEADTWKNENS